MGLPNVPKGTPGTRTSSTSRLVLWTHWVSMHIKVGLHLSLDRGQTPSPPLGGDVPLRLALYVPPNKSLASRLAAAGTDELINPGIFRNPLCLSCSKTEALFNALCRAQGLNRQPLDRLSEASAQPRWVFLLQLLK